MQKRTDGLTQKVQVIEGLPSKCKALSSNPGTIKKKKKEKKDEEEKEEDEEVEKEKKDEEEEEEKEKEERPHLKVLKSSALI
jgi:hypothetical protein